MFGLLFWAAVLYYAGLFYCFAVLFGASDSSKYNVRMGLVLVVVGLHASESALVC